MNRNLIIEKEIKDFNKLDVVLENTEKLKSYIQSRIENFSSMDNLDLNLVVEL